MFPGYSKVLAMSLRDKTLNFSISQEDPRIDHTVCKCTADDHVITSASAGLCALDPHEMHST